MIKYIKYDTALRYIKDASMRLGGVWGIEATAHFEHEPTIEIIHCGECKYWHKNRKEGDGMNVFDVCYDFQADDFCSYGEREGE